MKRTFTTRAKVREILTVLLPIFVSQLALVSAGFFDTVMAGHCSEADLAGVAIGFNLYWPIQVSLLSTISGIVPTISQLYGGGVEKDRIRFIVQQGFYWAAALGIVFLLLGYAALPFVLPLLHLEERVSYVAAYFLMALSFSILPNFLSAILRNFMEAHGYTRLTMKITMMTVPIGIVLNYIFMFGAFGMPAFGAIGAGIGNSVMSFVYLALCIYTVMHVKLFREYRVFSDFPKPDVREWIKELKVGLPIGCTIFCEHSTFCAVGLLMAVYGTAAIAAHQSSMNFVSIIYMLPLAASMALTILVGYEVGAGRQRDAAKYISMVRKGAFVCALLGAAIFYALRPYIAVLYTDVVEVQEMMLVFLTYAAIMHVGDGMNAPLQGALRGYKDVKAAFLLAVVTFWFVAIPMGWILSGGSLGPYGYWFGMDVSIYLGAFLLAIRLYKVQKKGI